MYLCDTTPSGRRLAAARREPRAAARAASRASGSRARRPTTPRRAPPPKGTILEAVGGWSGFARCVFDPEVRARLLADGPRRARNGSAAAATFVSTDAPALQQLVAETFPHARFVGGGPAASWEAGLAEEDYAKVFADFEVLKHCDVIVGPVTSGYAKTAARESTRVSRVLNQHSLGICPHHHRGGASRPSRYGLEQCQPITPESPVRIQ